MNSRIPLPDKSGNVRGMRLKIKEVLQWAQDNDIDDLVEEIQKLLNQRAIYPDDDEVKFWIKTTPDFQGYKEGLGSLSPSCKTIPFDKDFFEIMNSEEVMDRREKTYPRINTSPFISKIPPYNKKSSQAPNKELGFDAKQGAVAITENIVAQELFSLLGNTSRRDIESIRRDDIISSRVLGDMTVTGVSQYSIYVKSEKYGDRLISKRRLGQSSFETESYGAETTWLITFPTDIIAEFKRG